MLHCIPFDGLTFRDCLCSRSERSRRLSAFLLFPTGCMHGRCTGRIAWLHCIQVTLSVARRHCIIVAVSVAGRFHCRGSLHRRCTKRYICDDVSRQLILVAWFCYFDRRTIVVACEVWKCSGTYAKSWLCTQSSKSRSRDHSVSPTLRNSAPAANCPAASQACMVA